MWKKTYQGKKLRQKSKSLSDDASTRRGIDLVRMGDEAGLFWFELHSNVSNCNAWQISCGGSSHQPGLVRRPPLGLWYNKNGFESSKIRYPRLFVGAKLRLDEIWTFPSRYKILVVE